LKKAGMKLISHTIRQRFGIVRSGLSRISALAFREPARKVRKVLWRWRLSAQAGFPVAIEDEAALARVPFADALPAPGTRCTVYGDDEVRVRAHALSRMSPRDERDHYGDHAVSASGLTLSGLAPHFWSPQSGMLMSPEGRIWPQSLMRGFDPRDLRKMKSVSEVVGGAGQTFAFHPQIEALAPRITGPCLLVSQSERQNYGHFLFDMVPLIDLGLRLGAPMLSWSMTPWQHAICVRMGAPAGRIKELSRRTHLVEQPVISNRHTGAGTFCVHPAIRTIFDKIKGNVAIGEFQTPRRFFLMRSQRTHRKLKNQLDLADALATRGVVALRPELLSFDEQVALFSQAELVVAEFGAALANVVFCAPKARIVEIIVEGQNDPWSAHLCGMLELEHVVLFQDLSEDARRSEHVWRECPEKLDYVADIPAICAVIDRLS
jgi:hypothetical protein